jgi:uncharacterized protein YcbK (DUF882 family)
LQSPNAPLSIGFGVGLAIGLLLTFIVVLPAGTALSRESDRTLRLYFPHTGERGEFTFKRNGRYDRREISKINHFLRDWRKEEDADIDPELLDLVWAIYRESGSRDEIHVVSAYRSPQTNAMLRRRSSGVAKRSQHMVGKAMDWFVTDVPLSKLRATAMKMQGGGVGYYPTSGSPFIHTDTGNVRAWPRMSRKQLVALFPNGKTLHLPPDGKPLPGYERALAERRAGTTTLAYLEPDDDSGASGDERRGVGAWLQRVLPGGNNEEEDAAEETPATSGGQQLVATAEDPVVPRTPRPRPDTGTQLAALEASPRGTQVAPSDAERMTTLAFAPPPKSRPDPLFLASSLGGATERAAALPSAGNVSPSAPAADNDPIALAFAAAEASPELPSQEDAAMIAAFAALHSAEEQRRRGIASPTQPDASQTGGGAVVVAAAMGGAPAVPPGGSRADAPAAGVVLPPDPAPVYAADKDAMERLIAQPTPASDPQFAQLAMPVPADGSVIYRAHDAGEAATAMNDASNLPVDRFAGAEPREEPTEERQGFFMRLFASLIE